jgi:hypothetical protein
MGLIRVGKRRHREHRGQRHEHTSRTPTIRGRSAPSVRGGGSREQLSVRLAVPEVAMDVARDDAGRWRHPVRLTRIRTDMEPGAVPLFGAAGWTSCSDVPG